MTQLSATLKSSALPSQVCCCVLLDGFHGLGRIA